MLAGRSPQIQTPFPNRFPTASHGPFTLSLRDAPHSALRPLLILEGVALLQIAGTRSAIAR